MIALVITLYMARKSQEITGFKLESSKLDIPDTEFEDYPANSRTITPCVVPGR